MDVINFDFGAEGIFVKCSLGILCDRCLPIRGKGIPKLGEGRRGLRWWNPELQFSQFFLVNESRETHPVRI